MPWDPSFFERSPMLEPYAACARRLAHCAGWPSRADVDELLNGAQVASARGFPLRTVEPVAGGAAHYERRVYDTGELELRDLGTAGERAGAHDLQQELLLPRAEIRSCERDRIVHSAGCSLRVAGRPGARAPASTDVCTHSHSPVGGLV